MKHCCVILFLCVIGAGLGCHHHAKENPAVATDAEETFKQRWIAKRMTDLQAGGVSDAREARRLATDEFYKKYPYLTISAHPERMNGSLP